MKRDMKLVRKILLYVEVNFIDVALYDIEIEGYDLKTIAYHCKICYDAKLISDYKGSYASDELMNFGVGSLTWYGHEFLEKIKDDTIWDKTEKVMKEKGIKFTITAIEKIATKFIDIGIQAAINSIT
ncbi:DUF2513 domain-containing protein [Clostridium estertheticum]|uniref:DUF2513 domain-containing protein n=1 Tax=Clostridium estertheticum TaxID=238834 RepID=UPI001CF409A9|nr:DUF2513 domain-containing protein [Clostridium estertheticum]MCB2354458.1 DUF2513 domain-containing protein [Clostridium estertheticum]WAG42429.1 DUF2513 domain-containing protein [Clostridium estertheticum]